VNTKRVSWALVTGPVAEPITLEEAKRHARISQTNDDVTIQTFITAAREQAEECLGRGLLTQTWQMTLDQWYSTIWLPRAAPLQSITTVQYYDTAGTLQTLASSVYDTDTVSRPARIVLKPAQSWPSLQSNRLTPRVIVTYVIGWSSATLVPERIKQGIRMYVAYLDANREGLEDAERAEYAAKACWNDCVSWIEPEQWSPYLMPSMGAW